MEEVKWCFVPTCLNSTRNTVNKWFVPIPVNPKRREIWFKAVNRNYCFNSERSTLYCCSDHFNLDEDAGSFFERNGEVVVKLKKSIVPRLSKGSDGLTPVSQTSPRKTIRLGARKAILTPCPNPSPQPAKPSTDEVVSLVDNSSDEDDHDEVGVVTSESPNAKKTLMQLKIGGSSNVAAKSQGRTGPKPGPARSPKGKLSNTSSFQTPKSSSYPKQMTSEAFKSLLITLRKSIPSIASQQSLPREQILGEAIEFIIQMRNKSDKRENSMQYVMESNGELTAKIQHLEHLIALHEKNEIVLTKEIVDRRLGALTAPRPASLPGKQFKPKAKR